MIEPVDDRREKSAVKCQSERLASSKGEGTCVQGGHSGRSLSLPKLRWWVSSLKGQCSWQSIRQGSRQDRGHGTIEFFRMSYQASSEGDPGWRMEIEGYRRKGPAGNITSHLDLCTQMLSKTHIHLQLARANTILTNSTDARIESGRCVFHEGVPKSNLIGSDRCPTHVTTNEFNVRRRVAAWPNRA